MFTCFDLYWGLKTFIKKKKVQTKIKVSYRLHNWRSEGASMFFLRQKKLIWQEADITAHCFPCVLITADSLLQAGGFSGGPVRYCISVQLEGVLLKVPWGNMRQYSATLIVSSHINKQKIHSWATSEAEVADVIFMVRFGVNLKVLFLKIFFSVISF